MSNAPTMRRMFGSSSTIRTLGIVRSGLRRRCVGARQALEDLLLLRHELRREALGFGDALDFDRHRVDGLLDSFEPRRDLRRWRRRKLRAALKSLADHPNERYPEGDDPDHEEERRGDVLRPWWNVLEKNRSGDHERCTGIWSAFARSESSFVVNR